MRVFTPRWKKRDQSGSPLLRYRQFHGETVFEYPTSSCRTMFAPSRASGSGSSSATPLCPMTGNMATTLENREGAAAESPDYAGEIGYLRRSLKSLFAFSHVTCRKISGVVSSFSNPRVARATHFPFKRAASGLLPCEMPAPLPSVQLQSLPKSNLLRWRTRKSREKSALRESALLPEFSDISA